MFKNSIDRNGMLILRVWLEGNSASGLRARITQSRDSAKPEMAVAVAATPADVCDIVRDWVQTFVDEAAPEVIPG